MHLLLKKANDKSWDIDEKGGGEWSKFEMQRLEHAVRLLKNEKEERNYKIA